jgi:O-antigen ligase
VAIALALCLAVLTDSPIGPKITGQDVTPFQTRAQIWRGALDLLHRTFPAGTGFGSFPSVYPLTEDPNFVDRFFVNHAHNDYLEITLEGGAPGLVLLAAFVWWWMTVANRAWRSTGAYFAKAATIASGVMLAHSAVDYPLRTAALATVFALSLGLMLRGASGEGDLTLRFRSARHVSIA